METAIRINHVSKEYRIGSIGGGTLRGDLQTWMARLRGKEDPNQIIGTDTVGRIGDRFLALDDINLDVPKGEALGIIGHNGAGKSTLLKLLCRVTAPTSGMISYNGRITSMLEVGTGFHSELTGRENVYMNGAILGMTRSEIRKKFDQIVEFAEIKRFIDTPVKRYSSGMYVKLAFAVAAHLDSDIMIMDEVLAVGDVSFQKKCLQRMKEAAAVEGRTVLYVSHNMSTIRNLCNRCIVLDHGRLIFDGDVEKAIEKYVGSDDQFCRVYQYSPQSHSKGGRHQIIINSIEFPNGFNGQCCEDDCVTCILRGKAFEYLQNVTFHAELETPDGMIIGAMFADRMISVNKNQNFSIKMSISFSSLSPDRYLFHLVADSIESYETMTWQDTVWKAFTIEVVDSLKAKRIREWNNKTWGHVRLPDMRISDL